MGPGRSSKLLYLRGTDYIDAEYRRIEGAVCQDHVNRCDLAIVYFADVSWPLS